MTRPEEQVISIMWGLMSFVCIVLAKRGRTELAGKAFVAGTFIIMAIGALCLPG